MEKIKKIFGKSKEKKKKKELRARENSNIPLIATGIPHSGFDKYFKRLNASMNVEFTEEHKVELQQIECGIPMAHMHSNALVVCETLLNGPRVDFTRLLPNELIFRVAALLHPHALLSVMQVNKYLYQVCSDNQLWQRLCEQRGIACSDLENGTNLKKIFLEAPLVWEQELEYTDIIFCFEVVSSMYYSLNLTKINASNYCNALLIVDVSKFDVELIEEDDRHVNYLTKCVEFLGEISTIPQGPIPLDQVPVPRKKKDEPPPHPLMKHVQSFIIILTGVSELKEKLNDKKFSDYFAAVGNDVEEITMFVLDRLRNAVISMDCTVYSFVEPNNLMGPIFSAVKDTILQTALREAGF